jgi:predicted RNA-binding protein with PIN domain
VEEPAAPLSVLRPALELAWLVARAGSQARPPEPAPSRLRPLLRAAKLPDRMLATVQKVVEDDDEFRQRVAKVADEALLGRGAWLWLVRPDGWQEGLAEVAAAELAAQSEVEGAKRARDTQRRLDEVRGALARAEAELALLRHRNVELAEQIGAEQQARRQAESDAAARVEELTAAQAKLAEVRASTLDAQAQVEQLTSEMDLAAQREAAMAAERDSALDAVRRLESALADTGAQAAQTSADTQETRAAVGDALGRAATAAHDLGEALLAATRSLGVDLAAPPGSPRAPGVRSAALTEDSPPAGPVLVPEARPDYWSWGSSGGPAGADTASGLSRMRGRTPLRLPPALFDDSIEAAAYLVRVSGVILIVDGYNVTLSSWPDLALSTQRRRLVDALAELVMRAGTSVRVVFDGAAQGNRLQPPAAVRQRMVVEFSPSEVEADEIIVATVDDLDPARPVVVATNDRRVRHEVMERGANVISVDQLLAVLGRVRSAG